MVGIEYRDTDAFIDEIPQAYKDIDQVMADAADLVEVDSRPLLWFARALGLNEDLCEAISLAHDLGHTPFGHAGQDALNGCMQPHGGFEHNLQSLRVVDELEERYPAYDGLNLSFETREGILKHCSAANARLLEAAQPGGVGHRFIEGTQPGLEAQLANLADEIAYNAHDIDDGLRAGLFHLDDLKVMPLFAEIIADTSAHYPALEDVRRGAELVRCCALARIFPCLSNGLAFRPLS